jgi:hypothetical protein
MRVSNQISIYHLDQVQMQLQSQQCQYSNLSNMIFAQPQFSTPYFFTIYLFPSHNRPNISHLSISNFISILFLFSHPKHTSDLKLLYWIGDSCLQV